ncbi:MAG: hypothetical protein NVSMB14_07490 [Isosphaeraceae bacterium]
MAATPVLGGGFLGSLPVQSYATYSTVPGNGDQNPYGIAVLPRGILVSNFNNAKNLQGTGSTIDVFRPGTGGSVFAQASSQVGFTTALGVLCKGFVIAGAMPTTDGTSATVGQASLFIFNRFGKQVGDWTSSNFADGPWDLAVHDMGDHAQIFVSNVLNGTVSRIDAKIEHGKLVPTSARTIASGYAFGPDPVALVVGPTGLAYDAKTDVLYVASTGDNSIYAVADAGDRSTSARVGKPIVNDPNLRGPLGLAFAPNGDLLTTNGDITNVKSNQTSEIVEYNRSGQFVDQMSLSSSAGAAFGIALATNQDAIVLYATNDANNTLDLFRKRRK